jgi:hypothetical protein
LDRQRRLIGMHPVRVTAAPLKKRPQVACRSPGDATVVAEVSSTSPDPNLSNNSDRVTIRLQ